MRRLLTLVLLGGACAGALAMAAGAPRLRLAALAPLLGQRADDPSRRDSTRRHAVAMARGGGSRDGGLKPMLKRPPVRDTTSRVVAAPTRDLAVTVTVVPSQVTEFALEQNAPNPVRGETLLRFRLPVTSRVRIDIYTITGQHVANPVDGEYPAGVHGVSWKATGDDGRRLPPGVYAMRILAGSFRATRKIVLAG